MTKSKQTKKKNLSGAITLYHYVGCINVICSFHARQSGESNPCSLRCWEAEIEKHILNQNPGLCNIALTDNAHIYYQSRLLL